jgi:hypothetical protein
MCNRVFANGDIQAEGLSAFATGRDENNDPVVRQITDYLRGKYTDTV